MYLYRFFLIEPLTVSKNAPLEVCRLEKPENPSAADPCKLVDSLYREQFTKLVELAQRSGCSPDFAEDIVQDVFRIAMEKAAELQASKNHVGWLVKTLRNRIGHNYRAMQYAQRLKAEMEKIHNDRYEDKLAPNDLYRGLISDYELNLLIRFYVEGRSIRSIAEQDKISYENCKKRVQRAKAHFYRAYRDLFGDD
jgi:RNA polymerase sigma factor (sigma-70 family)